MKNIFKKITYVLLILLMLIPSISNTPLSISAEETEPIEFTDEIYELGTYDEVFGTSPLARNTPAKVERYAKIFIENEWDMIMSPY